MRYHSSVDDFLNNQERCRVSGPRLREALEQALSRIPRSVYELLVQGECPLYVLESSRISGVLALGCGRDFGMNLLTLSRELDGWSQSELVGLMAHELAHLALGHQGFIPRESRHEFRAAEELEAHALACQWGFGDELASALEAFET
jgi:hypothetical protein